jgi:hypothetical protein
MSTEDTDVNLEIDEELIDEDESQYKEAYDAEII